MKYYLFIFFCYCHIVTNPIYCKNLLVTDTLQTNEIATIVVYRPQHLRGIIDVKSLITCNDTVTQQLYWGDYCVFQVPEGLVDCRANIRLLFFKEQYRQSFRAERGKVYYLALEYGQEYIYLTRTGLQLSLKSDEEATTALNKLSNNKKRKKTSIAGM